jgi:hypothetical protein
VERSDKGRVAQFDSSRFYFAFDDGSESAPDNWDGYLNLIWTGDAKRDQIVGEQIQRLVDELERNGFIFVESESESTVIMNMTLKSVRFDPILGWITDDAKIAYIDASSDIEMGSVVADEVWYTPKLKWVINSLVEGSLELWGQE